MLDTTTSITTVDEVVTFLKDQHTKIKYVLPSVLHATGSERATAFAIVRQTLAIHEAFEQVVLHPHARSDAGADVIEERIEEEEAAGAALAELEKFNPDDKEFHDGYAAFMLDIVEHAEHEEHQEFDAINHDFTEDECAQIARGVALTHSGANAPSEHLTFADMLENAKQAISGHDLRSPR